MLYDGRRKQVLANGDATIFELKYGWSSCKGIYVRANGDIYDVFKSTGGKLTIIRKASIIDIMAAVPLALCMASLTSIGYFWDHKLRLLYPGVRPPAITRRKEGWEPESLHEIGALTVPIRRMNKISWVRESLFAVGALTVGSLSTGDALSKGFVSKGALLLGLGLGSILCISQVLVEVGHVSLTVAVKRVYSTFFLKK